MKGVAKLWPISCWILAGNVAIIGAETVQEQMIPKPSYNFATDEGIVHNTTYLEQPLRGLLSINTENEILSYQQTSSTSYKRNNLRSKTNTTRKLTTTCLSNFNSLSLALKSAMPKEKVVICAGASIIVQKTLQVNANDVVISCSVRDTGTNSQASKCILDKSWYKDRILTVFGSSITLQDLSFQNGSEDSAMGGAILLAGMGEHIIERCTFKSNHADNGGAIYVQLGALILRHSRFEDNSANVHGGVMSVASGSRGVVMNVLLSYNLGSENQSFNDGCPDIYFEQDHICDPLESFHPIDNTPKKPTRGKQKDEGRTGYISGQNTGTKRQPQRGQGSSLYSQQVLDHSVPISSNKPHGMVTQQNSGFMDDYGEYDSSTFQGHLQDTTNYGTSSNTPNADIYGTGGYTQYTAQNTAHNTAQKTAQNNVYYGSQGYAQMIGSSYSKYPLSHQNTDSKYPLRHQNTDSKYPLRHQNTDSKYPLRHQNTDSKYPLRHQNTGYSQGSGYGYFDSSTYTGTLDGYSFDGAKNNLEYYGGGVVGGPYYGGAYYGASYYGGTYYGGAYYGGAYYGGGNYGPCVRSFQTLRNKLSPGSDGVIVEICNGSSITVQQTISITGNNVIVQCLGDGIGCKLIGPRKWDDSYGVSRGGGKIFNIIGNGVTMRGISFENSYNLDGDGGALYITGSNTSILLCRFLSNVARNGGAVYSETATKIANSIFAHNEAVGGRGGALYSNIVGGGPNDAPLLSNNRGCENLGAQCFEIYNSATNGCQTFIPAQICPGIPPPPMDDDYTIIPSEPSWGSSKGSTTNSKTLKSKKSKYPKRKKNKKKQRRKGGSSRKWGGWRLRRRILEDNANLLDRSHGLKQ